MRLGIPLVLGVLFLNPILCFVADRTHDGYEGNYLSHYKVYFTKFTDWTGYDGGFTLGHLWFIAVLIVISFLSCGIIKLVDSICKTSEIRSNLVNIIFTTIVIAGMDYKLWGKPLITYLFVYLLGYRLFSKQEIVTRLAKCKWICIAVFIIASISNVTLFIYLEKYAELNTFCNYFAFCFVAYNISAYCDCLPSDKA